MCSEDSFSSARPSISQSFVGEDCGLIGIDTFVQWKLMEGTIDKPFDFELPGRCEFFGLLILD